MINVSQKKKQLNITFFVNETWFCIRVLLLANIGAIQIYYVQKGERVNHRSMNADTVEWFFGDAGCCQYCLFLNAGRKIILSC